MHFNNRVIKNNYVGSKTILLFKISVATRNNFFEVNGHFGHAPSNFRQPCCAPICHTKQQAGL